MFRSVIPYVQLSTRAVLTALTATAGRVSGFGHAAAHTDLRFIGQRSQAAGSRTATNERAVRYYRNHSLSALRLKLETCESFNFLNA